MYHIIPYLSYEFNSTHKKELIIERYCNSVTIVQKLSITKTDSCQNYEGTLHNNGFKLRRIFKQGYSAFLPILSCEIIDQENVAYLKVSIRFHKYVNIGLSIFLLLEIAIFGLDFNSFFMLLIPYTLIISVFNKEVKLLNDKLLDIIKQ